MDTPIQSYDELDLEDRQISGDTPVGLTGNETLFARDIVENFENIVKAFDEQVVTLTLSDEQEEALNNVLSDYA